MSPTKKATARIFLTGTSILLIGLWAISYFRDEDISFTRLDKRSPPWGRVVGIGVENGSIRVNWARAPYALLSFGGFRSGLEHKSVPIRGIKLSGITRFQFESEKGRVVMNADGTYVNPQFKMVPAPGQYVVNVRTGFFAIPIWLPLVVVGALPACRLLNSSKRRRQRRKEAGLCVACGYDLRSSPDRCPECGAPATE